MVRSLVTLTLLFLACAYAVPVPANPKFTLVKDSSIGNSLAGFGSKTSGVVADNKSANGDKTPTPTTKDDVGVEAPFPGNTGSNVPDVTVFDNVHAGNAFAVGDSVSTGVMKNNVFASNPFG